MRIVAGTLKGRRLAPPNWSGVRPTSDRVRETLFDLLGYHVEGARFLDACAGTGAVGIEALSRGAAYAAFVDCDRRSTGLVEKNLAVCRVSDRAVVVRTALPEGVTRPELAEPFDVIVADPPYGDPQIDAILFALAGRLAHAGLLVLERDAGTAAPDLPGIFIVRTVTAGDTALDFLRRDSAEPNWTVTS